MPAKIIYNYYIIYSIHMHKKCLACIYNAGNMHNTEWWIDWIDTCTSMELYIWATHLHRACNCLCERLSSVISFWNSFENFNISAVSAWAPLVRIYSNRKWKYVHSSWSDYVFLSRLNRYESLSSNVAMHWLTLKQTTHGLLKLLFCCVTY